MEWTSGELVSLLRYLLPGFFAAWVFYGLTSHRSPTPFERVIQALIFTAVVQVPVVLTQWILIAIGTRFSIGEWTTQAAFVWAMVYAAVLGHILALCANRDLYHRFLRAIPDRLCNSASGRGWIRQFVEITKRTAYPSEWFSAFNYDNRYVVLHLTDGRRLFGWPNEWPDQPSDGHFVLMQPEWVLENNDRAPLHNVERMIIPVGEIRFVDILKYESEINVPQVERQVAIDKLVSLHGEIDSEPST